MAARQAAQKQSNRRVVWGKESMDLELSPGVHLRQHHSSIADDATTDGDEYIEAYMPQVSGAVHTFSSLFAWPALNTQAAVRLPVRRALDLSQQSERSTRRAITSAA
jgi:hypothetical protein